LKIVRPNSLSTSRIVIISIAHALAPQEINLLPAMKMKEVELDDNKEPPSSKIRAVITKESSRLHSTSRDIGSTEVLIPLHLYNADAISIAPSEKAILE